MYHVIGSGGSKFGPADVTTLKQWVTENRVTPTTMLEDAVTGRQFPASELTELFPQAAGLGSGYPSAVAPGGVIEPPKSNPSAPYGTTTPGSQSPYNYSNAPQNSGTPYVRPTGSNPDAGGNFNTISIVLTALSLVTCCCSIWGAIPGFILAAVGVFLATKAKEHGYTPTLQYVMGGIGMFLNIAMIVMTIIGFSLMNNPAFNR